MKRIFILFILISSYFHSFTLQAQSSSGWKTATSIISNSSWGDVGWSNPLFALVNDGSRTSSTALIIGDDTEYLQATGFNINVPAGMVIKGIEVEIIKNGSNGLSYNVTDNEVRIIKGGVVTGNNLAASGKWPSSDQTYTYGSASETWGTTWTLADVNSSNFGIAISAHLGGLLLPTARINGVSINVSYGIDPLPVKMISFDAKATQGKVDLSWVTATEVNNHGFTVQRSVDAVNWENIGEILSHFGNSETVSKYTYTDFTSLPGNNYYSLLQRDTDNSITYTNVIVVNAYASNELSL